MLLQPPAHRPAHVLPAPASSADRRRPALVRDPAVAAVAAAAAAEARQRRQLAQAAANRSAPAVATRMAAATLGRELRSEVRLLLLAEGLVV